MTEQDVTEPRMIEHDATAPPGTGPDATGPQRTEDDRPASQGNEPHAVECRGLRYRFGEDRRRQHRTFGRMRQRPLVERHVLDADDALVGLELRNPIDQQERVAVRQNPLDRGVVQRQGQRLHNSLDHLSSLRSRHRASDRMRQAARRSPGRS